MNLRPNKWKGRSILTLDAESQSPNTNHPYQHATDTEHFNPSLVTWLNTVTATNKRSSDHYKREQVASRSHTATKKVERQMKKSKNKITMHTAVMMMIILVALSRTDCVNSRALQQSANTKVAGNLAAPTAASFVACSVQWCKELKSLKQKLPAGSSSKGPGH